MKKNISGILSALLAVILMLSSLALAACDSNAPSESTGESNKQEPDSPKKDLIDNLKNYDERYAKGIGDILIFIFDQEDSTTYSVTLEFKSAPSVSECFTFILEDDMGKEFIGKAKSVFYVEESDEYVRILTSGGTIPNSNESGFYEYLSSFIPEFPKLPISSSLSEEEKTFIKKFYRSLADHNAAYANGIGDISISIAESNGKKSYTIKLGYLSDDVFNSTNLQFDLYDEQGEEFLELCKDFEVQSLTETLLIIYTSTEKNTTSKHVELFKYIDKIINYYN